MPAFYIIKMNNMIHGMPM